jgi:hypothetical protein
MENEYIMSKDKLYGYGIFLFTLIFLIAYTIYLPLQQYFGADPTLGGFITALNPLNVTVIDALLWPVYLATLMIGFIIAWIGITMATTPPPEPIDLDDLNLDEEEFEEEEKED